MRRLLLPFFILALCAIFVEPVHAQVQVGLNIKRRLFVAYEPILATVSIRNLSGRDLPLADQDGHPWFGFQIFREKGQPVAPLASDYQLEPLIIPAGQTVQRTVNLNDLFPLHDYGLYRIRANIYFSPMQRFFESTVQNIEISEGKVLWQQTVGIPDGEKGAGGTRKLTVLKFRQAESNYLYVRVEDGETGVVYCTFPADKLITGMEPDIQLDVSNKLHILQVVGPKTYLLTRVGLNGELLSQETYLAIKTRPGLKRDKYGEITVRGGQVQSPEVAGNRTGAPSTKGVPKLSDRPVNIPKE